MKMPANDLESQPVESLPLTRPPFPVFAGSETGQKSGFFAEAGKLIPGSSKV